MKVGQLRTGQRFKDTKTNKIFIVRSKEGNMVEVEDQNKLWAWPINANVVPL